MNDPILKTDEFKQDLTDLLTNMDPQFKQDCENTFTNAFDAILTRSAKIIGLFTLTGITCTVAYWLYLKDLNNQLIMLLQESLLDDLITIAPKQSVEKIILCDGMISKNFNFHIFNRSQVPVTEFAIDLNA